MKMKYVECQECKCKNEIFFTISKKNSDFISVDHLGREITGYGEVGNIVKNLDQYDFQFCECHGDCNDEMAGFDVKLILSDDTEIVGDLEVWEYLVENL